MCGGEEGCVQRFGRVTEGRRPLGGPSVGGRIILRWIFKKWRGRHGLDIWLRIETGGGHL